MMNEQGEDGDLGELVGEEGCDVCRGQFARMVCDCARFKRRTGRTHRMLLEAVRLSRAGEAVYVVLGSWAERGVAWKELVALGADMDRVSVFEVASARWFDVHEMQERGGIGNVKVLVDHLVVEKRYAGVLAMWTRFDVGTRYELGCECEGFDRWERVGQHAVCGVCGPLEWRVREV